MKRGYGVNSQLGSAGSMVNKATRRMILMITTLSTSSVSSFPNSQVGRDVTHTNPQRKIAIKPIFFLIFICSFHIILMGMQRINKSPMKDKKPFAKPIVVNETQCPFLLLLFQK